MEHWRLAYLGMRRMPRDLSEFELATFFTFSSNWLLVFWGIEFVCEPRR